MSKKPPIVMVPPPRPDWDCELDPVPPDVAAVELLFWPVDAVSADTWPDGLKPPRAPCWKAMTVITPSTEATTREQAISATATRSLILRATTGPSECDLLGMQRPGPRPAHSGMDTLPCAQVPERAFPIDRTPGRLDHFERCRCPGLPPPRSCWLRAVWSGSTTAWSAAGIGSTRRGATSTCSSGAGTTWCRTWSRRCRDTQATSRDDALGGGGARLRDQRPGTPAHRRGGVVAGRRRAQPLRRRRGLP